MGRVAEWGRLGALALRLTWRASPALFVGILALLALQAALAPVELVLVRVVIDEVATGAAESSRTTGEMWLWVGLLAVVLGIGQLIQPLSNTLRALIGDRPTGYVTGELFEMQAGRYR
jgi:hypothetical protein